jgi:hypothetical protein
MSRVLRILMRSCLMTLMNPRGQLEQRKALRRGIPSLNLGGKELEFKSEGKLEIKVGDNFGGNSGSEDVTNGFWNKTSDELTEGEENGDSVIKNGEIL